VRGKKRVIDAERDEISDLTVDELRAIAVDVSARVAALRRRWQATLVTCTRSSVR
jgi:hypothetical protein